MNRIQFARFFSLLLTLALLMQCFAAPALAAPSPDKNDTNDKGLIIPKEEPNIGSNNDKIPIKPDKNHQSDMEINPDEWDGCTHPESRRISERTVPASCETDGYYEYTCDCGFHERITTRAFGHAVVIEPAVEPTCTEAGSSEGRYCSICGLTIIYKKQLPAKGHTIVTDAAVAASCAKTGLTEGSHCSVCGTVLVAQKEIPTIAHTVVIDRAITASCDSCGLTEGSHCSVCGTVLVKQNEIPATGHTIITDNAVAASCESSGLTEGSHCSVCQKVLVKQNEVPATGHTIVTDAAVAASCESSGLTEGSHCSVCQKVLVKQNEIPATGHTIVTDNAVAASCTKAGLTEGSHCSVCQKVLVKQNEIPADGHTIVTDAAVAPTCTERGLTEGSHCSVCGKTIKERTYTDEPLAPHAYALEFDSAQGKGKLKCANCSNTIEVDGSSIDQLYENGYISAYDYATIRPATEKERLDLSVCLYIAGKLTTAQYNELTNGYVDPHIQQRYGSDYLDPNADGYSYDSLSGNDLSEDSNIDYAIAASQSTSDGGSKQSIDIQNKPDSTATKATIHMNDSQLTMEAKQGQSLPNRTQVFTVESGDGSITTVDLYENGKPVDFNEASTVIKEDGSSETILISDSGTKYTYSKDTTQPPAEEEGNDTLLEDNAAKDYSGTNTDPITSTATQTPTAKPSPTPTPTSPVIVEAGSGLEYGKDFHFDTGVSSAQQEQEATAMPSPTATPSASGKDVPNAPYVDSASGKDVPNVPYVDIIKNESYSLTVPQNISAAEDHGVSSTESQNGSGRIASMSCVTSEGYHADVPETKTTELTFNVSDAKSGSDPNLSIIDQSTKNGSFHALDLSDDAKLQELLSSYYSSGDLKQAHQLQQALDKQLGNEGNSQSYTIIGSGDNAYAVSNNSSSGSDSQNSSAEGSGSDNQNSSTEGSGIDISSGVIDISNNNASTGGSIYGSSSSSDIDIGNNDININSNSSSSGGATYSSSSSDISNNNASSGSGTEITSEIHSKDEHKSSSGNSSIDNQFHSKDEHKNSSIDNPPPKTAQTTTDIIVSNGKSINDLIFERSGGNNSQNDDTTFEHTSYNRADIMVHLDRSK